MFSLIIAEFVQCIDKLFDEKILIGSGWTTQESLRFVLNSEEFILSHCLVCETLKLHTGRSHEILFLFILSLFSFQISVKTTRNKQSMHKDHRMKSRQYTQKKTHRGLKAVIKKKKWN